ncbi:hypothetical protein BDZ91DRAFT_699739 [Kalaharituber pfeilii]|nr:hypothetical protein BDZ91DRAFT_699739 [Kalaharituber pfeilii]
MGGRRHRRKGKKPNTAGAPSAAGPAAPMVVLQPASTNSGAPAIPTASNPPSADPNTMRAVMPSTSVTHGCESSNNSPAAGPAEPLTAQLTVPATPSRRRRRHRASTAAPPNEPVTGLSTAGTTDVSLARDQELEVATKPTLAASPQMPSTGRNQRPREHEYHHFIPRFVLREFRNPEARTADKRNPRINLYDMGSGVIDVTADVKRSYGNFNMYRDLSATDEMYIEDALARLEREVANIVQRIRTALQKGEDTVTLTRVERNKIRKFLFLMKFRLPLFWGKYNRSLEDYDAVDRTDLLRFMQRKGFKKPLEVWLHSIRTILDTPIDVKERWEQTVMDECFSHDAYWFKLNMNLFFTAFCTPTDPDDEFLISNNAFGIHEGPTWAPMQTFMKPGHHIPLSAKKGKYTEYHLLAPFGPRLLLVLRNNYLEQYTTPSVFEHLYLQAPTPSYELNITADEFELKDDDTFTFKLHKLCRRDVQLFNSIILNEVTSALTWASDAAMERTLQVYLNEERFRLPRGFSFASRPLQELPDVVRREQLWRLLAAFEAKHGRVIQIPSMGSHFQGISKIEFLFLNSEAARCYFDLGGVANHFTHNLQQAFLASRMRTLVKEACRSTIHTLPYRNAVQRNLYAFLSTLPSSVIYLHVKLWLVEQRYLFKGLEIRVDDLPTGVVSAALAEEVGAVDAVANVAHKVPKEHHSKLMLEASLRLVLHVCGQVTGNDSAEDILFDDWGGIISSFWLEGTEFYKPSVRQFIFDPDRDSPPTEEMFATEMFVRWSAQRTHMLEAKWGEDVADFVWEWLYGVPED